MLFVSTTTIAQTPDSLINELKTINSAIARIPCDKGSGNVISNRGLNLFLAGKIGSYLSEGSDLSFYKNNITFNSADGQLTVNHNLFQASGLDKQVRSFMVVGAKANITNAYASTFEGKRYFNQFGFALRHIWIAKATTRFAKCGQQPGSAIKHAGQKPVMDAIRAALIHSLEIEIHKKENDFEHALTAIDSPVDVPGQDLNSVKATARKNFNEDLSAEYNHKYADIEAQTLLKTNNYRSVSTSWTTIGGYIPLILERFTVAKSLTGAFNLRKAYPLSLSINHTRFFESTKAGRLFLTISAEAYWNNSKESQALQQVSYDQYKLLGGSDTINVAKLNATDLYLGNYTTYITPLLKGKIVYIPPDWHFGITLILEKNFGTYKALNGTFGIPIVLIDKHANPSVNFEFQLRYFDIGNVVIPDKKIAAKTSVGVSIGVPFSKIIY